MHMLTRALCRGPGVTYSGWPACQGKKSGHVLAKKSGQFQGKTDALEGGKG